MSGEDGRPGPAAQDDVVTLEAELRRALQHQRAEMERAREAQEELSRLIERARGALERARQEANGITAKSATDAKSAPPCHPERSEGSAPGGRHPAEGADPSLRSG
jgi:hypothetical protein